MDSPHPRIAFGPCVAGWGSWEWVGLDTARALRPDFDVAVFDQNGIPEVDVVCVIKHPLPQSIWSAIPSTTRVIYAPIDAYGSAAEIDADFAWLRRCDRIVIHCERLRKYFASYGQVEYLDHHVKFVGDPARNAPWNGPILWTGVRSNLEPLVDWVNRNRLPRDLLVLTNPEDSSRVPTAQEYGFSQAKRVEVAIWSPVAHTAALARCSVALDIKGNDFRARHKPPAKALDFLAAGLPLAMNADSSSVEHLVKLGLDVCDPDDIDRWFSAEYRAETQRFGAAIRELLSLKRVAYRWKRLINEVVG